jgi:hypothetical protein
MNDKSGLGYGQLGAVCTATTYGFLKQDTFELDEKKWDRTCWFAADCGMNMILVNPASSWQVDAGQEFTWQTRPNYFATVRRMAEIANKHRLTFGFKLFTLYPGCHNISDFVGDWAKTDKYVNEGMDALQGTDFAIELCNEMNDLGTGANTPEREALRSWVKANFALLKFRNVPAARISLGACLPKGVYQGNGEYWGCNDKRLGSAAREDFQAVIKGCFEETFVGEECLHIRPVHNVGGDQGQPADQPLGWAWHEMGFFWGTNSLIRVRDEDDGVRNGEYAADNDGAMYIRPGPVFWRQAVRGALEMRLVAAGTVKWQFVHHPKRAIEEVQRPTLEAMSEGYKDVIGEYPENFHREAYVPPEEPPIVVPPVIPPVIPPVALSCKDKYISHRPVAKMQILKFILCKLGIK